MQTVRIVLLVFFPIQIMLMIGSFFVNINHSKEVYVEGHQYFCMEERTNGK